VNGKPPTIFCISERKSVFIEQEALQHHVTKFYISLEQYSGHGHYTGFSISLYTMKLTK
jgi:hypothetical protein